MASKGGPRRGSSMFTAPSGGGGGAPPGAGGRGAGGPGQSKQRNSVMLQPAVPGAGLIDFDSDYESEEDERMSGPGPSQGGGGGYPGQPIPGVSSIGVTTGSAQARPLVGGFAAAAYEAAKAHHYANQGRGKKPNAMPQRRPQGP